jgi:hypothetical protein
MKKLLLNIEWFWIDFSSGFYNIYHTWQWWKTLMTRTDKIPNIFSIMFWTFISGEQIEIISYEKLAELEQKRIS